MNDYGSYRYLPADGWYATYPQVTDTDDMVELTYEGYGPGGVAVMVECMTDNRNRTAAAVRQLQKLSSVAPRVSTMPAMAR